MEGVSRGSGWDNTKAVLGVPWQIVALKTVVLVI